MDTEILETDSATLVNSYHVPPPTPVPSEEIDRTVQQNDLTPTSSSQGRTIIRKSHSLGPLPDVRLSPIAAGYQPPRKGLPAPIFTVPRRRFPVLTTRLLPTTFPNPAYLPLHPGTFPESWFQSLWTSAPVDIADPHIISIQPEAVYFGTEYFIKVDAHVWMDNIISRGTVIIFRGYSSAVTKYMATWQLKTQGKVAFVQFSAFCINQETHYHDPNWPTLRITVPVKLCRVPRQRALPHPEPVVPQQEDGSVVTPRPLPPVLPWWKNVFQWILPSRSGTIGLLGL